MLDSPAHVLPPVKLLWREMLGGFKVTAPAVAADVVEEDIVGGEKVVDEAAKVEHKEIKFAPSKEDELSAVFKERLILGGEFWLVRAVSTVETKLTTSSASHSCSCDTWIDIRNTEREEWREEVDWIDVDGIAACAVTTTARVTVLRASTPAKCSAGQSAQIHRQVPCTKYTQDTSNTAMPGKPDITNVSGRVEVCVLRWS